MSSSLPMSRKTCGWSKGGLAPTHWNSLDPISICASPSLLWKCGTLDSAIRLNPKSVLEGWQDHIGAGQGREGVGGGPAWVYCETMTKLMDQAIEYLRQLPAEEQDAIAYDILASAPVVAHEPEHDLLVKLLAEAEADFANGRFVEDSDEFWEERRDRIRRKFT